MSIGYLLIIYYILHLEMFTQLSHQIISEKLLGD